MRKFIVAILSILYLASTSGATVHLHYCMGELVNAKLTSEKKDKCGKCGMSKKKPGKGCCQDKHQFIKAEQGQQNAAFDMPSPVLQELFISPTSFYGISYPIAAAVNNPAHAPPLPLNNIPLFLRYCNFRI